MCSIVVCAWVVGGWTWARVCLRGLVGLGLAACARARGFDSCACVCARLCVERVLVLGIALRAGVLSGRVCGVGGACACWCGGESVP